MSARGVDAYTIVNRRSFELSLTARGRRLEKRIIAAREQILHRVRERIGAHDPEPTLELFRDLLEDTPLGNVIAWRGS